MEVTSFNWLGKFELMKLVQTIEVAFNDTPAEIPAIEVNDRCTIHNINVSRHKNITAVDTTFGFFFVYQLHFHSYSGRSIKMNPLEAAGTGLFQTPNSGQIN